MKNLKLLVVALVAMFGFIACDKHVGNDHDHSADLVGTWTCLTENYAEALIIKADGTAVSYGVEDGEYWENVKGTVTVKDNNITMIFEEDDNWTGHFDVIPGMAFSLFEENGECYVYQYCANDLADEIVGMWICMQIQSGMPADMFIQTFKDNGKSIYTGYETITDSMLLNKESSYKVIGDLCFLQTGNENKVMRLTYSPKGTTLGDIMIFNNADIKNATWLRIKQSLNLTGTYDYSSAYISNVKGKDEDFTILGHTFNMADIKGGNFDMLFRSELFCVDLNTNTITQHFLPANGQDVAIKIPTTVEGNKVTLDYSAVTSGLRKVDMYMFQDADDSQLHMYMHTDAFINYFANLEVATMLQAGEINSTDAAAVEKVYTDMKSRIESINVSFVFKARK